MIACNGIETPKLLLLSKDERNPQRRREQLRSGRPQHDGPAQAHRRAGACASRCGPGSGRFRAAASQHDRRATSAADYTGAMFRMENFARSALGAAAALKKGLVGKALGRRDPPAFRLHREADRRARTAALALQPPDAVEQEGLARHQQAEHLLRCQRLCTPKRQGIHRSAAASSWRASSARPNVQLSPEFLNSDHIMGGCIMGADAATSVVDVDCRAHDHHNLFLPGGGAMPSGTASNSTLTMAALALKAADAIVAQLNTAEHAPPVVAWAGAAHLSSLDRLIASVSHAADRPRSAQTAAVIERGQVSGNGRGLRGLPHRAEAASPLPAACAISTPLGTIYSTNITPSADFGIGRYTEEDFVAGASSRRSARWGQPLSRDALHILCASSPTTTRMRSTCTSCTA